MAIAFEMWSDIVNRTLPLQIIRDFGELGDRGLEAFCDLAGDDDGITKIRRIFARANVILATFLLNVVFTRAFAVPILRLNRPMRNIFLLYMPPGNTEAMVHYQDTIRNKVGFDRIAPHVSPSLGRKLQHVFGPHSIAVWGSRDSSANRSKFDRMNDGDEILIVEGETIKLLGRVAVKLISPSLSAELWKNIRGDTSEGWNLIYFIANPRELISRSLNFADYSDTKSICRRKTWNGSWKRESGTGAPRSHSRETMSRSW